MSDERPHEEEPRYDEREADQPDEAADPQAGSPPTSEGEAPADHEQADGDSESPLESPTKALQRERDELFERLQRVSADYQNYIKRAQQNLSDSISLAKGDLAKQFIGVLDHFDNALSQQPEGEEARRLYDGVRIVRDELMKVLVGIGVERIDVEPGEPFDPNIHEALLRQAADGVEPGRVSAFYQPGYRLGDRVLRPAKVAVAPENTQE